ILEKFPAAFGERYALPEGNVKTATCGQSSSRHHRRPGLSLLLLLPFVFCCCDNPPDWLN
ncbi:Hypothetical predicted protein, partial [Marmota monax]